MTFFKSILPWFYFLFFSIFQFSVFFVTIYGVTKSITEFHCLHKRQGPVVYKTSQKNVYYMEDKICLSVCTATYSIQECDIEDWVAEDFLKTYYFFISFILFCLILMTLPFFDFVILRKLHNLPYISDYLMQYKLFQFCNPITRKAVWLNRGDNLTFLKKDTLPLGVGENFFSNRVGSNMSNFISFGKFSAKVIENSIENSIVVNNDGNVLIIPVSPTKINNVKHYFGQIIKNPGLMITNKKSHYLDFISSMKLLATHDICFANNPTGKFILGEECVLFNTIKRLYNIPGLLIWELIQHNRGFFGSDYDNALFCVLNNKTNNSDRPENCKNSQWKLYTSDCNYILNRYNMKIFIQKKYRMTESAHNAINSSKNVDLNNFVEPKMKVSKKVKYNTDFYYKLKESDDLRNSFNRFSLIGNQELKKNDILFGKIYSPLNDIETKILKMKTPLKDQIKVCEEELFNSLMSYKEALLRNERIVEKVPSATVEKNEPTERELTLFGYSMCNVKDCLRGYSAKDSERYFKTLDTPENELKPYEISFRDTFKKTFEGVSEEEIKFRVKRLSELYKSKRKMGVPPVPIEILKSFYKMDGKKDNDEKVMKTINEKNQFFNNLIVSSYREVRLNLSVIDDFLKEIESNSKNEHIEIVGSQTVVELLTLNYNNKKKNKHNNDKNKNKNKKRGEKGNNSTNDDRNLSKIKSKKQNIKKAFMGKINSLDNCIKAGLMKNKNVKIGKKFLKQQGIVCFNNSFSKAFSKLLNYKFFSVGNNKKDSNSGQRTEESLLETIRSQNIAIKLKERKAGKLNELEINNDKLLLLIKNLEKGKENC